MSMTYVIPDIHGRYDLLCDGLAEIAVRAAGKTSVIVTIGDYVDKGPDSREVIDRLLSGVGDGFSLVALKGNHDAMMLDALRDPAKMAAWIAKGGDAALASYGGDPTAVPQTHIGWLDGLRLMHIDAHRLYVHAGVDPKFHWIGKAKRRCYGSAIPGDMPEALPIFTSSMATITIPKAPCCTRAVPTWTRSPGRRDG